MSHILKNLLILDKVTREVSEQMFAMTEVARNEFKN